MYNTGTGIKAFARFVVEAFIEQDFEDVPSLKDSLKDKTKRAEYEVENVEKRGPFRPEGRELDQIRALLFVGTCLPLIYITRVRLI